MASNCGGTLEGSKCSRRFDNNSFSKTPSSFIEGYLSYSKYFVRNPVQAALRSDIKQKANKSCEYFWFGRTLRPEASRNLF